MEIPKYISHLCNDGSEWHFQSNDNHCQGTAFLAEKFASKFGMGEWGKVLGLLHDRGKESEGFQAHIKKNSGFDLRAHSNAPSRHSIYGAKVAHNIGGKDIFFWLSNPIAGHHRGLYDWMELEKELEGTIPDSISDKLPNSKLDIPFSKLCPSDSNHIVRMLFSCLVDADRLDTENFMSPEKAALRSNFTRIADLLTRLQDYIRTTLSSFPSSPINRIRNEIQDRCSEAASMKAGFFDLTVPTGGGKTIASILWALNHAVKFNKDRIIIAIPFTSIIVQTAATLKKIFGENNVIEHHSALNEDSVDESALLATENWDAPIIVTTNVQLFESVFSNKPSKCRKLHSIANSIVILDEVQTLPLTFLQPIVDAMNSYARLFDTTFLFTTATQPVLTGRHKGNSNASFSGILPDDIISIVPADRNLSDRLRRVKLNFLPGRHSHEEIARKITDMDRVLCIVNTRKDALDIFNSLPTDHTTFHLSRYMCSAHIMQKIDEIKRLLTDTDLPVKVVSTQLIEAGVDIDFPVVLRQLTGLDSILQAAGRCNREGKLSFGSTTVFSLLKDSSIGYMRFAIETMKDLLSTSPDADWFSPDMINLYYRRLYSRSPSFDKKDIAGLLNHPKFISFQEASENFRLIDEEGINIIVNFGGAEELIERLKRFGPSRHLSRELGHFSVNVPIRLFKSLEKGGLIEEPWKGFFFIPLKSQYDEMTGLKIENNYLEQNLII